VAIPHWTVRRRVDLELLLGGARSVAGWNYLESFLAAGVGAVLLIRAYLGLTGFPQLGGHGLHIAHMLWGGAFMVAAIVLLLTILGYRIRHSAAILGGIGFGTFIDELGKFITSDNNYFFKPTIAIIYVIFVLLFLLFRWLENWQELTPEAWLANAAELVVSGLSGGTTTSEVRRGLTFLERSGMSGPAVDGIRQALMNIRCVDTPPSIAARIEHETARRFDCLAAWPGFSPALLVLLLLHATIFPVAALAISFHLGPATLARDVDPSVAARGDLVTSLISSGCILVGTWRWRRGRLDALRWFKRGILASILLVQVFLFYASQLGALTALAVDVLLLLALNQLIREAWYAHPNGGRGSPATRNASAASR
jgi:hypothetical protein